MKKLITTLLAICLLVSLLAVPASAAAPGDWSSWFPGFNWLDWFYQQSEEQEQIEQEATEPEYEETSPEVVYEAEEFVIRYDANGGYWWSQYASPAIRDSKKCVVDAGESHTLIAGPIRTGYTFIGWKTELGDVLKAGDTIIPKEDMKLKAVWG